MSALRPTHTDRLPDVPKTAINKAGWIACPYCKQHHGLFYRRHSNSKQTLHYLCNKVKHTWWEVLDGKDMQFHKHVTRMGDVEYVSGLPVHEDWTAKCKSNFQKEHTEDLLK